MASSALSTDEMAKESRGRKRETTILVLVIVVILQRTIISIFQKDPSQWTTPTFCGTTTSTSVASRGLSRTLRITHVVSPFVPHSGGQFYPLDHAQSIAWSSIIQARERYRRVFSEEIHVVCALMWTDVDILTQYQPSLCQPSNTVVLNRSSHTEYPYLVPPINYPFIQDIISAANSDNYDYLIFSNADIALTQDFYIHVRRTIEQHGYDAFRVNRRTISSRVDESNQSLGSGHLQYIEKELLPLSRGHPGTDCFIMGKEVVEGLDMGMMFSGYPPWAGALNWYLILGGSQNYKSFGSEFGWTYHLGNEKNWMRSGNYSRQGLDGVSKEAIIQAHKDCPLRRDHERAPDKPMHWQQNVLNCAAVANTLHLIPLGRKETKIIKEYYEAGEGRPLAPEAWEMVEDLIPLAARRKTVFVNVNTNERVVPSMSEHQED